MRQTSSHKLGLMILRNNFTSPIQNLCISKHSSRSKATNGRGVIAMPAGHLK